MSDNTFAVVLTVATFGFLAMWVPFLDALTFSLQQARERAKIAEMFASEPFQADSLAID